MVRPKRLVDGFEHSPVNPAPSLFEFAHVRRFSNGDGSSQSGNGSDNESVKVHDWSLLDVEMGIIIITI